MATNRELLKEALADAKSLREMAITNAKAALEESFAPQIKEMLSQKLQEMEDEEVEEDMVYEVKDEEEEEVNEDLNLDEILAELEADDEDEKLPLEESDEVDEDESEEEEEEEEASEEDFSIEDMSSEDLKDFVEGIIADMFEDGEFKPDEDKEDELDTEDEVEVEDEGEEVEMDFDGDIDINELLAEIEDLVDDEDKDDLDENFLSRMIGKVTGETKSRIEDINQKIASGKKLFGSDFKEPSESELESLIDSIKKDAGGGTLSIDRNTMEVVYTPAMKASGANVYQTSTFESLQTELNETRKVNKVLRRELNEINLLNAKLLYTNRIFKAKNLTEGQKVKVLSTFDRASNVNEVELVYETLNGSFNTNKKPMNESLGRASRISGTTKASKPIIEVNEAYKRMTDIAFYNAKH